MWMFATLGSVAFILVVLADAFQTMLLPRRVSHSFFARFFYRSTWGLWRLAALWGTPRKWRGAMLSLFGPLSLLALFVAWELGLVLGFALLHWSLGTLIQDGGAGPSFGSYLSLSGGALFTVGYGDATPASALGRTVVTIEAGTGLGFLAVIIGYLPVLYQAFSRREVTISLLDARAGSPPSAAQLLVRLGKGATVADLVPVLEDWEKWSAELLESHLSFPMLSFYRSQHDNQSWLATLAIILDTSALLGTAVKGSCSYQAELTFAMARHAVVDLSLVLRVPPLAPETDRLPESQWQVLREQLRAAGLDLHDGPTLHARLAQIRGLYEPFLYGLAHRLALTLPRMVVERPGLDNWQRSAWIRWPVEKPGLDLLAAGDDHFTGRPAQSGDHPQLFPAGPEKDDF
jgi:hypothetical protein